MIGSIVGMTKPAKVKVSVTLSRDLLDRIDREAEAAGNRSSVIEAWLRRAAADATRREIDEATERYYERVADDERLSRGLSRAARKLRVDDA